MPLNCIAFMTDCYSCIASMAFGIAIPLRFYSEILVLLNIFTLLLFLFGNCGALE